MKLKLDQKTVASLTLEAGRNEDFAWDTELEGFGLRLRRGVGKFRRTYVAQYRADGRTRRMTIGPVERLTPAQARERARQILGGVSLGGDPQAEKVKRRIESATTLRSVVDLYLGVKKGEMRDTSFDHAQRYLIGAYWHPLHGIGINKIRREDVAARLTTLSKERGATTVRCARAKLSALFRWAMEEGLAESNPVVGTRKPVEAGARERVLNDAELVAIWHQCRDDDYGRIVRLLILTGCRRQEVGGMRFSEFSQLDLSPVTWTVPKERCKNNHAITIPLSPMALELVRAAADSRFRQTIGQGNRPRVGDRDLLFGVGGFKHDKGFRNWGHSKKLFDELLIGKVTEPWHIHDIRRTVATRMADIGVQPHIIEAVLNHYSGHRRGVAGVYNRSPYEREVKTALLRWSEHVLALVEGREDSTVVAFPA
jgi:integrase